MKIGDQVKYSDQSVEHAKGRDCTGELLADLSGREDIEKPFVISSNGSTPLGWKYIAPAEEHEHFTYETFPDGLVMFKHKTDKHKGMVTETYEDSLLIGKCYMGYSVLMDEYLVSLDMGITWQVAGIIKTGESS